MTPTHDPTPDRRTQFLHVLLPEDIEPDERHDRYASMLDAELRLAGVGAVTGGGTMMQDREDEDNGESVVLFCGIDVETPDVGAARALLREQLPGLGCKAGTRIEFRDSGSPRCDRYDGAVRWLALDPDGLSAA